MRAPKLGGGSMSDAAMSSTSLTASTTRPMTWRSSAPATSTITTQVRFVVALDGRPKRACRSITGTTAPRRLITPRTHAGIIGTSVTPWYSMISLMLRMPIANCSSASMNVRYWSGSAPAGVATAAGWRV